MKRALVASGIMIAFLCAISLAVSPQLHERLHPDAGRSNHECAVTLTASGSYHHSAQVPLVNAPVPAVQFPTIPALTLEWVEPSFLGASIFEHAPPAHF